MQSSRTEPCTQRHLPASLQAAAAVAQQRAELNHLKAELLLAREDLAAERASRLKLQAAIASQAHAEASRARQEPLQQAAVLPAGFLQPSDSIAALVSPVPAQEPSSMVVVSSGSTRFGRPAQVCARLLVDVALLSTKAGMPAGAERPMTQCLEQSIQVGCTGCTTCVGQSMLRGLPLLQTLTIPDAGSVSAFPSPEAAALQPPEPAPQHRQHASKPRCSLDGGAHRYFGPTPSLLPRCLPWPSPHHRPAPSMRYSTCQAAIVPAACPCCMAPATRASLWAALKELAALPPSRLHPRSGWDWDSPAARALRAADTKTLDKGSLIFVGAARATA